MDLEHDPSPENQSPEQDSESSQHRTSRARERVKRRKDRRKTGTTPTVRRGLPRQLTPAGGFNLSRINIPYARQVGLISLAGVFMLALILLVGLFKNDPVVAAPNAIWLGQEWSHADHTDADIDSLTRQLRDNEIGTIYAWVGTMTPDGRWSAGLDSEDTFNDIEAQVQAFTEQFSRLYPEARLFAWLNIPVISTGENTSTISNEENVGSVSAFSLRMINNLAFDGILLDVEPIFNNDNNYLRLLQRVRGTIGQDVRMGASVPPDWTPIDAGIPTPSVIAPGTIWDVEYKQRVALLVDDVVVQAYNSYLSQPSDYAQWVAYQVEAYALAIDELQTTTNVVIGLPAFTTELPAHDASVENLTLAISGVQQGLSQSGDASQVIGGVALFQSLGMDAENWERYRSLWLN